MKLFPKSFTAGLAALLLLGFAACEKPVSKRATIVEPEPESEAEAEAEEEGVTGTVFQEVIPKEKIRADSSEVTLPVDRILRDSRGRDLDATIIGRSSLKLTVIRRVDQSRLDVPIDSLSVEDQAWARTLAFQAAPINRRRDEGVEEEVEEPPYVKSRRQQIIQMEDRIRRMEAELKTLKNPMLIRSNRDRVKDLREDIAELEADIELYEGRSSRG